MVGWETISENGSPEPGTVVVRLGARTETWNNFLRFRPGSCGTVYRTHRGSIILDLYMVSLIFISKNSKNEYYTN